MFVGDMIRFGQSSRMFIVTGPEHMQRPEASAPRKFVARKVESDSPDGKTTGTTGDNNKGEEEEEEEEQYCSWYVFTLEQLISFIFTLHFLFVFMFPILTVTSHPPYTFHSSSLLLFSLFLSSSCSFWLSSSPQGTIRSRTWI